MFCEADEIITAVYYILMRIPIFYMIWKYTSSNLKLTENTLRIKFLEKKSYLSHRHRIA